MAILHVSQRQAIGSPWVYPWIFPWISTKKSVDMDVDMDGKFHIHGNPAYRSQPEPLCLPSLADNALSCRRRRHGLRKERTDRKFISEDNLLRRISAATAAAVAASVNGIAGLRLSRHLGGLLCALVLLQLGD